MLRHTTQRLLCALMTLCMLGCAAQYHGMVEPVPQFSALSPELEHLTDAAIDTYLKADVKARFPTVLAIARVNLHDRRSGLSVEYVKGEEAHAWASLTDLADQGGPHLVSKVQFVSPMLCGRHPTLKSLRDAAALLHAPVLVVYMQEDNADEGQNAAAMAYWTIVGLFTVPGNTVGRWSVCQLLVIDTQTGFILATAQGESKGEEEVLPGAVDIARRRLETKVPAEAIAALQQSTRKILLDLAVRSTQPAR